jgi:hypothetical protein
MYYIIASKLSAVNSHVYKFVCGAWGSVVVKALRY